VAKVLLQVNIRTLRIASVDTGSAVAIGNNHFYDWQTLSKTNNGLGRLSGDRNSLADLAFRVDDPDLQDMFSHAWPTEPALRKLPE